LGSVQGGAGVFRMMAGLLYGAGLRREGKTSLDTQ